MKRSVAFLLALMFVSPAFSQSRMIRGRIIDDNLEPVPGVVIHTDSIIFPEGYDSLRAVYLGITDIEGLFEIELPVDVDEILISSIGYDPTSIDVSVGSDCDYWEIILLPAVIIDFATWRQIAKHEKKRYEYLPELHRIAFEKGLFTSPTPYPSLESRREYIENTRPVSKRRHGR